MASAPSIPSLFTASLFTASLFTASLFTASLIILGKSNLQSTRKKCKKLGIGDQSRTLLLCLDVKTSKCSSGKQMMESWKFLKKRLKELGLHGHGGMLRMKTGCMGICRGGPILSVMPDGVWYGRCTPEVIERIIQNHLLEGKIVKEFVIAEPAD